MNFKKVILTFTLSLILYTVRGQEGSLEIVHRRIEFDLSISSSGPGSFLTPAIGYGTNRHSVYLAPLIYYKKSFGYNNLGIMSGYKFYPIRRLHRINPFFSYNLLYFNSEKKFTSYHYTNSYLENIIGLGGELKLFVELYFTTEIGFGIDRRWGNNNHHSNGDWLYTSLIKLGIKKRFQK